MGELLAESTMLFNNCRRTTLAVFLLFSTPPSHDPVQLIQPFGRPGEEGEILRSVPKDE